VWLDRACCAGGVKEDVGKAEGPECDPRLPPGQTRAWECENRARSEAEGAAAASGHAAGDTPLGAFAARTCLLRRRGD
jgi:hypothetical protein